jgi:hypothetical protein
MVSADGLASEFHDRLEHGPLATLGWQPTQDIFQVVDHKLAHPWPNLRDIARPVRLKERVWRDPRPVSGRNGLVRPNVDASPDVAARGRIEKLIKIHDRRPACQYHDAARLHALKIGAPDLARILRGDSRRQEYDRGFPEAFLERGRDHVHLAKDGGMDPRVAYQDIPAERP